MEFRAGRASGFAAFALLGTLAVAAVAPAQEAADLSRFRKAFQGNTPAADRMAAARGLLLVDTKPAAELLCKGLEDTFERLDALSRGRGELRRRIAKVVEERGDAKSLLNEEANLRYRDAEEWAIVSVLQRSLTALRDPHALEYLAQAALRGSLAPAVRARVAEALGGVGGEIIVRGLMQAVRDRNERVREAALSALARTDPEKAMEALGAAIDDEAWTVRLSAARSLAAQASPGAVDLLLARLPREDGRLRRDIAGLLRGLTGQKFGVEPEGWTHWWTENREAYASGTSTLRKPPFPPDPGEEKGGGGVSYYGITTYSRRILFIVDISGSMNTPGIDPAKQKVDEAKAELLRTVATLDKESSFTILAFDDAVRIWRPTLVKADPKNREAAEKWVGDLWGASWTNTFGALEEGFRLAAGNGMDAEYGGAADTIFLLTDGAPTVLGGKLKDAQGVPETKRVLDAFREWNRENRVVVHTIGIGPSIDVGFLKTLAQESGGEYRRVQ